MIIWFILFFAAIYFGLISYWHSWTIPVLLVLTASADAYGVPVFGTRFSAFTVYISLLALVFIPKYLASFLRNILVPFHSPLVRLLMFVSLANVAFLYFFYDPHVSFLYIKYIIYVFQAYIVWHVIRCMNIPVEYFIRTTVFYIIIVNFTIIFIQTFGPETKFFVASTTYGLSEWRDFGFGVGRPYGLSREPAHMILPMLMSVFFALRYETTRFFLATVMIWIAIAVFSETRSLVLSLFVFIPTIIILESKSQSRKWVGLSVLFLLVSTVFLSKRMLTGFSFGSDESTLIRYGTTLAGIYNGLTEFWYYHGHQSNVKTFCDLGAGEEIFQKLGFLCRYPDIKINWSIDFFMSLPYWGAILVTIGLYRSAGTDELAHLLILVVSGLIFYVWSSPYGVIMLLISMLTFKGSWKVEDNSLQGMEFKRYQYSDRTHSLVSRGENR